MFLNFYNTCMLFRYIFEVHCSGINCLGKLLFWLDYSQERRLSWSSLFILSYKADIQDNLTHTFEQKTTTPSWRGCFNTPCSMHHSAEGCSFRTYAAWASIGPVRLCRVHIRRRLRCDVISAICAYVGSSQVLRPNLRT